METTIVRLYTTINMYPSIEIRHNILKLHNCIYIRGKKFNFTFENDLFKEVILKEFRYPVGVIFEGLGV